MTSILCLWVYKPIKDNGRIAAGNYEEVEKTERLTFISGGMKRVC